MEKGLQLCAVSLGSEGALFISTQGVWRSDALNVQVMSTVGAGDSMVGSLVYGLEKGLSIEECCALSVAASAAACTTQGTKAPSRDLTDRLLKEVSLRKIT
jgi:1-phosphofructokinase